MHIIKPGDIEAVPSFYLDVLHSLSLDGVLVFLNFSVKNGLKKCLP